MARTMSVPEVVTLGEALGVLRPDDASPVTVATRFVLDVAGAESNVAVGLSRLGHRVAFVGRVGDDATGRRIRRTLLAEQVDVTALRTDPTAPTGLLVRSTDPRLGISVDYHRRGSAGTRLCPADVDAAPLAGARFLHVTGLSTGLSDDARDAVQHAVRTAVDADVAVCLDPNLRLRLHPPAIWQDLLAPLLTQASLVVTSSQELCMATGEEDPSTAIRALLAQRADAVVVRNGTDPTQIHTAAGTTRVDVTSVAAVDPVGAGDAFNAGLLSGLVDSVGLRDAVARGHLVARRCVLAAGDTAGLPTREELEDVEEVRR